MQIRVKGRHLSITSAIREYALSKAAKLPRYFDRIRSVDVVAEAHDYRHRVEMIVHVAGSRQ